MWNKFKQLYFSIKKYFECTQFFFFRKDKNRHKEASNSVSVISVTQDPLNDGCRRSPTGVSQSRDTGALKGRGGGRGKGEGGGQNFEQRVVTHSLIDIKPQPLLNCSFGWNVCCDFARN